MNEDRYTHILERAHYIWRQTAVADHSVKMDYAAELYAYRFFSLNQLAKICRVAVPTVARKHRPNAAGGRFEPESLTTLLAIRSCVVNNQDIPKNLLRVATESGTSLGTVASMTGTTHNALYRKATP